MSREDQQRIAQIYYDAGAAISQLEFGMKNVEIDSKLQSCINISLDKMRECHQGCVNAIMVDLRWGDNK